MKNIRLIGWAFVSILVLAAFLPGIVKADTPSPQDTNTIFLPVVVRPAAAPSPTPLPAPQLTNIIDHTTLPLYDQIPQNYIQQAEQIRMAFMDRSVGDNVDNGLDCLASSNWASSASLCRRYYTDSSLTDWKTYTSSDSYVPPVIQFPGGDSRNNITFVYSELEWEQNLAYFIQQYPSYANNYDIFTLWHNYLHVTAGSTIDDVYFDPNYGGTNIYDMLALEARYPNKTFVYWTTSLARTIGTYDAQHFNDQMRAWARQNNKILIDAADILSHDPDGNPCVNAQGYEIICKNYTTEQDGGHLGSVSAGMLQVSKGIWILLAELSGWNGHN